MRGLRLWFAVLLAIIMVGDVKANVVLLTERGDGIGNVRAVLVMAFPNTESGCVSWNGTVDIIGPAACPPGITGGNENTGGAVQTKTLSIDQAGVVDAQSLRLVFNPNETGGDSITLDQLVLTIYGAATGAILFRGSLASPVTFPATDTGVGFSGPLFALDAAQAALAQAAFGERANRIGLAAQASLTSGGFENFFIINATPVPTMSTWLLLTLGTLLVGAGWMALRQRRLVM
jgi:hypothetical protein